MRKDQTLEDGPVQISDNQLWTVRISGSSHFQFSSPGNPVVSHGGGTSVAHLVLTPEEAQEVRSLILRNGCSAEIRPTEGQTETQKAERSQEPATIWPCIECPMCPWFDPFSKVSPCGRLALPQESVAVLRETSDLHSEAEKACPLCGGRE